MSLLNQIIKTCQKLDLKPDVIFAGQYFIIDLDLRNKLVNATPHLPLIEIGPGLGTLTEPLAKRSQPIIAIEIDSRLKPILLPLQEKYPNLLLIFANVLKISFHQLKKNLRATKMSFWLVGNLPYQLVEPLILKLAQNPKEREVIAGAVFLVSERSGQEMVKKKPPRTKLGILSNSFFQPQLVETGIEKTSFWPPPRTRPAIIKLTKKGLKELMSLPPDFIWHYLFEHTRAKIKNALREAIIAFFRQQPGSRNKPFTKNQARKIINDFNLPTQMLEKSVEQLNQEELNLVDKVLFSFFSYY